MTVTKGIDYTFEQVMHVGIFSLKGELTGDCADELKLILMRAIHSTDRSVLSLKDVTAIDQTCRALIRNAYCVSLRMKSSLIIIDSDESLITDDRRRPSISCLDEHHHLQRENSV